jgi:hypothetical protein
MALSGGTAPAHGTVHNPAAPRTSLRLVSHSLAPNRRRRPSRWCRNVDRLSRRLGWLARHTPTLLLASAITFVLIHALSLLLPEAKWVPTYPDARSYVLTLWQVTAALGGLALVILVFLVESIGHTALRGLVWKRFVRSKELHVPAALIFGTTLSAGFSSLLLMQSADELTYPFVALRNLVILDSLLFAAATTSIAVLYLRLFSRLDPAHLHQLLLDELLETVSSSVTAAITLRHDRRALRQLCGSLAISTIPDADLSPGMVPIQLHANGFVEKIHTRRLRQLVTLLKRTEQPIALLAVTIGSRISPHGTDIIFVELTDHSPETMRVARRMLQIRPMSQHPLTRLQHGYTALVSQTLQAIASRDLGEVRQYLYVLSQPLTLAVELLEREHFRLRDLDFDNLLWLDIPMLERPFREYERIIDAASASADRDMILEVSSWPTDVMTTMLDLDAIEYYERASGYVVLLYNLSRLDASSQARVLMRDRAWRNLQSILTYDIPNRIRLSTNGHMVQRLSQYTFIALTVLADLMKRAIDNSDPEYIDEILNQLQVLVTPANMVYGLAANPTMMLSLSDNHTETVDEAKAAMLLQVRNHQSILRLSLVAWTDLRHSQGTITDAAARRFLERLTSQFVGFEELWTAFRNAVLNRDEFRLPLSRWEAMDHAELIGGVTHSNARLARAFAILSLGKSLPIGTIPWIGESIADASGIENLVSQALDTIPSEGCEWANVTGDAELATKRARLLAVIQDFVLHSRHREETLILEQDISATKVEMFKTDVMAAWQEHSWLRHLLEQAGKVHEVRAEDITTGFGIAEVTEKEPFLEDTGSVQWPSTGKTYGAVLARSETAAWLNRLGSELPQYRLGTRTIAQALRVLIKWLRRRGYGSLRVAYSGPFEHLSALTIDTKYNADRDRRGWESGYWTSIDDVPVYIVSEDSDPILLLFDVERLCTVHQRISADGDAVSIRVQGFDLATSKQVAKERPRWLPDSTQSLDNDELALYLRARVKLWVVEDCELVVDDPQAGVALNLNSV